MTINIKKIIMESRRETTHQIISSSNFVAQAPKQAQQLD